MILKINKFHNNSGNNYMGYKCNNYKNFKPKKYVVKELSNIPNKNVAQKKPLKWWECGGPHYFKYCSARKKEF